MQEQEGGAAAYKKQQEDSIIWRKGAADGSNWAIMLLKEKMCRKPKSLTNLLRRK